MVQSNFVGEDLLLVFVQKAELADVLLAQVLDLDSVDVVVLEFAEDVAVAHCLLQGVRVDSFTFIKPTLRPRPFFVQLPFELVVGILVPPDLVLHEQEHVVLSDVPVLQLLLLLQLTIVTLDVGRDGFRLP